MTLEIAKTSTAAALQLREGLLKFLGSLGQRSEAELYLRIYRELSRHEFALLVPSAEMLQRSAGTLAEQLAFLRDLGLYPTIVLGGLDPVDDETAEQLSAYLQDVALRTVEFEVRSAEDLQGLRDVTLTENDLLVVRLPGAGRDLLAATAAVLSPRKTLVLRSAGGLGPHGVAPVELAPGHFLQTDESGIGVINLRSDLVELRSACLLSDEDEQILGQATNILEGPAGQRPRATVSVTSPLSILRELFTVSGDGTLIKLGAAITTHRSWEGLDQGRIRLLLEESFGRPIQGDFFARAPLGLHLEDEYRGLAFVERGEHAAFLSKFAVLPVARGEGLGQDLWWALSKTTPSLYWRSRPTNPINSWYATVCDGMHRAGKWNVYWRGAPADRLPDLIRDAINRPEDFVG